MNSLSGIQSNSRTPVWPRQRRHLGAVAVVAMIYLALMSLLALAMASIATLNVRTAYSQDGVERARASAETGLRWLGWRFSRISMPTTTVGYVDGPTADSLWRGVNIGGQSGIMDTIQSYANKRWSGSSTINGSVLTIGPVALPDGSTFTLTATPGNVAGLASPANTAQVIQVKAVGKCVVGGQDVRRAMVMQFLIQKSMRYAVVSKTTIQLGKNTLVEGDVYVAAPPKTSLGKVGPPVFSVSDFRYTSGSVSDTLTTQVQKFQDYLNANYSGRDNRIQLSADTTQATDQLKAIRGYDSNLASISDYNLDGYIDEYDLFLQYFDKGTDRRVQGTKSGGNLVGTEFYQTAPLDQNLFYMIDQGLGKPINDDDAQNVRTGYNDGYVDSDDPYAKIKGHVRIWETEAALKARLKSENVSGQTTLAGAMQGAIVSPDGVPAVQFGVNDTSDPATQLTPSDFTMGAFLALAGKSSATKPAAASPDASRDYKDTTITATVTSGTSYSVSGDANGTTNNTYIANLSSMLPKDTRGNLLATETVRKNSKGVVVAVTENVPYGSTDSARRGTVTRPVFSNLNFKNCIINRGTNPLFINCRFDGVTFIDGSASMSDSNSLTNGSGNSIRFVDCTFTGPLAQGDKSRTDAPAPTSLTVNSNNWEFSGATVFDLRSVAEGGMGSKDGLSDSSALAAIKEQATIMAPQTNIEMGSFTAPGKSSCSFQGVVVAGVFDVRGVAYIDGSIVALDARNAADTVTLGYFGPNDANANQGQPDPTMQTQGVAYGGIHIRFNPYRSLPDGINLAVSMRPDPTTWREVTP